MPTLHVLLLVAAVRYSALILKKLVGQPEGVQPALVAAAMHLRRWVQVVHVEGVSLSVGNSRTRRAVHTEQRDCGRVSYPHGGNWRGGSSSLPAHPRPSVACSSFRGEQSFLAKLVCGTRTTVTAFAAASALGGCAFLVDRGPTDPGSYAQCQKRGCL